MDEQDEGQPQRQGVEARAPVGGNGGGQGEVGDEVEAVRRGDGDGAHGPEAVLQELGAVHEQEIERFGGPMVNVVVRGARVGGDGDDPGLFG